MRYLVLLKAASAPTSPPPPDLMAAIMALGEEATSAGALLDTQGLLPSAAGTRVALVAGSLTAADGTWPGWEGEADILQMFGAEDFPGPGNAAAATE